jgi:hypothetical protein
MGQGDGLTKPDILVLMDPNQLSLWYGGDKDKTQNGTTFDATTILTHELLHGFGFSSVPIFAETGDDVTEYAWWLHLSQDESGISSFVLPNDELIGLTGNKKQPLGTGHLLNDADLMGRFYMSSGPNAPISETDTAILKTFGFSDAQEDNNAEIEAAVLQIFQIMTGSTPAQASFDNAVSTMESLFTSGGAAVGWNGMGASLADSSFATAFAAKFKVLDTDAFISAVTKDVFGAPILSDALRTSLNIYIDFYGHSPVASDPTGTIRAKGYFIADMLHQAADINFGPYEAPLKRSSRGLQVD